MKKLIIGVSPFALCIWLWTGVLCGDFLLAAMVILGVTVTVALAVAWCNYVDKHFND